MSKKSEKIVEIIQLHGFDPEGEPEVHREAGGNLWLIFNFMPPSWMPEDAPDALEPSWGNFGTELSQAIDADVDWEDREVFYVHNRRLDALERIQAFLIQFAERNKPKT
jgi:hypothetical protein